jgi:hypothetical protein
VARRANPAADRAAQAVVIYDLHRPGSFGLPPPSVRLSGPTPPAVPAPAAGVESSPRPNPTPGG